MPKIDTQQITRAISFYFRVTITVGRAVAKANENYLSHLETISCLGVPPQINIGRNFLDVPFCPVYGRRFVIIFNSELSILNFSFDVEQQT